MAKRFTETEKWSDPWFSDLESKYKLLWLYILDKCDNAGILQVNYRDINHFIGIMFEPTEIQRTLKGRIVPFNDGNLWFIPKFITFQYGDVLSDKNMAVKNVIAKLSKYNLFEFLPETTIIEGASKEHQRGLQAPKEKEEDKDKLKVESKEENKEVLLTEQQKNFELIDFQAVRTLGRKLTFIEKEELEKYLIKFGEEMLVSQLRKAGMNNFKSIGTFLKNTNEKGFLILRNEADAEKLWTYQEKNKYIFDNNVGDKEYFEAVKIDGVMQGFRKIK